MLLREGLQDEKQGHWERKGRRQGIWQRQGQDDERNRKERRRQVRTFDEVEDTKGNAGRVARQDASRRSVDGESTTWMMMMTK